MTSATPDRPRPTPGPPRCGLCRGPVLVRPVASPTALLPTVRVCPKCDHMDLTPGKAPR